MNDRYTHQDKAINKLFQIAQRLDWVISDIKSHNGYRVKCPERKCTERISSTPRVPENEAMRLKRTIESCNHTPKVQSVLEQCSGHLDKADQYLEAAETKISSLDRLGEAAASSSEVSEVDALLEEAADLEARANSLIELCGLGSYSVDSLVGAARKSANRAVSGVMNLPVAGQEVRKIRDRVADARKRIKDVTELYDLQ